MASQSAIAALRRELPRKALHAATAALPVAYALGLPRATLLMLLLAVSGAALIAEWARRRYPRFRALLEQRTGFLFRDRERHGMTGATWLALSCCAACALLPRPAAIAALWCVTAGDASAALAGLAWDSWRDRKAGARTFAGSFALAGVGFAGVLLLTGVTPLIAALVGLAAAAAERIPWRLDDNVTVMAGAALSFLALT